MIKKMMKRASAKASQTTKKTTQTKSKKASWKDLSQEELHSLIEKKAYELFEKRGYSHGDDFSDWFEAEKLVKKSLR